VGLSNDQIIYVPTGISNIVWNPSGTKRNVQSLFEDGDLHFRILPLCPTGRAHACGVPADNHKLHIFLLSSLVQGSELARLGTG